MCWILGSNFLVIVCEKSIFTLILNVSDKFIEKCRRSRLGQNGVLRYGHFSDFLELFGDRMANLGLIDFKIGLYIKVNVILSKKNLKSISKNLANIKSRANILTRVQSKAYTEPSSFSSLFNLSYSEDIHYSSQARHIAHSTTQCRKLYLYYYKL